jgi:hypothetical protein
MKRIICCVLLCHGAGGTDRPQLHKSVFRGLSLKFSLENDVLKKSLSVSFH